MCQIEAVETAIWLTEVAPTAGKAKKGVLDHLEDANHNANPEIMRLALKLATGSGKTTVMAMLIAWQTVTNSETSPCASGRQHSGWQDAEISNQKLSSSWLREGNEKG